jgi:putative ATPase
MKEIGYGKNYKYSHSYEGNFEKQDYLPEAIKKERIYHPQNNATEIKILERLKRWWGERFQEGKSRKIGQ